MIDERSECNTVWSPRPLCAHRMAGLCGSSHLSHGLSTRGVVLLIDYYVNRRCLLAIPLINPVERKMSAPVCDVVEIAIPYACTKRRMT